MFASHAMARVVTAWNCHTRDGATVQVQVDTKTSQATVTQMVGPKAVYQQIGNYQQVAAGLSLFVTVTQGKRTIFLVGASGGSDLISGFVQLGPNLPQTAITCSSPIE